MKVISVVQAYKDFYPLPGTRMKQYVVDMNRESDWERSTCPRFNVEAHCDNTELSCRNVGNVPWTYLAHDCCGHCEVMYDLGRDTPEVKAWLEEKAKRPLIETDRAKLSDEVAQDVSLSASPFMAMLKKGKP